MDKSSGSNIRQHPAKNYSTALPWIIWFLAALFYFYENVIQVSPAVMVSDLMTSFAINSAALGSVIAFFFYSYAAMQIPVGVLVDNYNVRFLLTGATLSCVLGCLLFGFAHSLTMLAAGRLLIGFGAAFACVCALKIAANWFPVKRFSLLVGLLVTIGMLGSMMGETPLALLVDRIGWRESMLLLAGFGIVLALLIVLIVRHSPDQLKNSHLTPKKTKIEKQSLTSGLLTVVSISQSWILAIYGGMMFASTSIFGGLWGVPFIMQTYSLDKPVAAGIVSMLFFGWVVGSPLSGLLVNFLNSFKKILWIGSIGSLIIMLFILYIPHLPIFLLYLLIFCFGLFSSFFLPSFTLMHDLHSSGNSGAALGFMNTANMIGGAVGQPLIGKLLDLTWDGAMVGQTRLYSTFSYQLALGLLPLLIAISLILVPFIKESGTHRH